MLAVNDPGKHYGYGDSVRFEINERDPTSYQRAADYLNVNGVDVLSVGPISRISNRRHDADRDHSHAMISMMARTTSATGIPTSRMPSGTTSPTSAINANSRTHHHSVARREADFRHQRLRRARHGQDQIAPREIPRAACDLIPGVPWPDLQPTRWRGESVDSWLDVIDVLYEGSWNADLQRFRSPFAFRGLGMATMSLASTLMRLARGRADVGRLEQALLRNFRKYAHSERRPSDSIWSWLSLGQHRGLPTRLLDWTYSPLVALHFATAEPEHFDKDGIVWCVNFVEANKRLPARLKRMLDDEGSETFTVEMLNAFGSLRAFDALAREPFVVFVEPPAIDSRILHQLALFSLMSSPSAQLDDWLRAHPELCRTVPVPAHLKWEIRDKLDQANVNERVLVPGLDGLSRWLTRYYTPAGHLDDRRALDALARGRSQGAAAPKGSSVRRTTRRTPAARGRRR